MSTELGKSANRNFFSINTIDLDVVYHFLKAKLCDHKNLDSWKMCNPINYDCIYIFFF